MIAIMHRGQKIEAEPTPFGRERARQIWEQRGLCWDLDVTDMTPGERAYVKQLWLAIPDGSSCWMDAFLSILNGH